MDFYVKENVCYINVITVTVASINIVRELNDTQILITSKVNEFEPVRSKITSLKKDGGANYVDFNDLQISLPTFFFNIEGQNSLLETILSNHSIYPSDVDFNNSDFTGWTGNPEDIFLNPFSSPISNLSGDNPKNFVVGFNKTVNALQIGIGDNTGTKFSNVKISLLGSGGTTRTLVDESTNNTKISSRNVKISNQLFNSVLVEFYTSDPIEITNLIIFKANTTLAQLEGKTQSGRLNSVSVDEFGRLSVATAKDVFGREKVAAPETVSDNSLVSEYSNFLFWSNKNFGTASRVYEKATSSNILSVLVNGDICINQTKMRNHYQPAKALEILDTFHAPQQPGVVKHIGYFDVDNYDNPVIDGTIYNGVALEISETTVKFQIWNNGVLNDEAEQLNWNVDTLTGNINESGILLDLDFPQIGLAELEWLGVGAVRVGFNIGGVNIPVHIFEHSNVKDVGVYMRSAKMPVCYMIKSVGAGGFIRQICNSVVSGGGLNPKGVQRSVFNSVDITINNNGIEAILGMRLKLADFDTTVLQESLSVVSRAKNDFTVFFCLNPIYANVVNWIDKANSSIQYAENGGAVLINELGIDLFADKVSGAINATSPQFDTSVRLGKGTNNDLDELWIIIQADDGTDAFSSVINFRELL